MDKKLLEVLGIETRQFFDTPYRVNTGVFLGAMLLIVFVMILLLSVHNFDYSRNLYIHCSSKDVCENPLYKVYPQCESVGLCDNPTVPSGFTLGNPPPFFLQYWGSFCLLIVLIAFLVNHLLFNKDFKWSDMK